MRSRGIVIAALALVLLLTGCGKAGRLDEGDCACVVRLESAPPEFMMLGDYVQELINIEVVLQNITTEKRYEFTLNMENNFQQEASLHPGVYRVSGCYASPYFICMDTAARQQDLEVGRDKDNEITVYIENPEEFTDMVWHMQPIREVTQLDRFSRKIQWNGEIIDLERIMDYVEFSSDQTVGGYQQITLYNSDAHVRVTLQNQTAQQASWKECKLIKVQFERPNAIFAQGVKVGMTVRQVAHAQEGFYGTPDSLTGSVLYAIGADSVGVVYYDEASGDRLTLESYPAGGYIYSITYEFAAYE